MEATQPTFCMSSIVLAGIVDKTIHKEKEKITAIALATLLGNLVSGACRSLKERRLDDFDALVSDTSCHVRASKIVGLVNRRMQETVFANEVDCAKARGEEIIRALPLPEDIDSEMTYRSFLEGHEINVSKDLLFVMMSYLLKVTKEVEFHATRVIEKTKHIKLQSLSPKLSSTTCDKIVKHTRKVIAGMSVRYVQEQALLLLHPKKEIFKCMVSDTQLKQSRGVVSSPCFYNFTVILLRLLECDDPLLIIVKRIKRVEGGFALVDKIKLFYRASPEKDTFVLA